MGRLRHGRSWRPRRTRHRDFVPGHRRANADRTDRELHCHQRRRAVRLGGSRWTVEFTQKYISYAFATGIKLFMLYLIIGVGTAQAKTWAALLATTDWNNIFAVMGGSMLPAFLGFQIPNMAAAMLSGAPSLTAGAAAATSGALAAGTVAAGATAISPALQSARGGMALKEI